MRQPGFFLYAGIRKNFCFFTATPLRACVYKDVSTVNRLAERRKQTHTVRWKEGNPMKKLISVAIILVTVFALMIPAFASTEDIVGKDMWVNCANGKKLNLRDEPRNGSNVILRLENGTKVHVDYSCGGGWVAVSDYHFSGYVKAEFLVASKPGKYEITERDDNFVTVTPYLVSAKAISAKSDRSVGLRVKPNKTANAIRRLTAGDELQVIARGTTWSKVIDLQTGRTGFVANDYIRRI